MAQDLVLAIDIGTGSVRAAAVDLAGRIIHVVSREHDQIVPQFGWAEQRAAAWWDGVVSTIRSLAGAVEHLQDRIAAICACGQMHGTVLLDAEGRLTRETVPLWNDKRTTALVEDFEARHRPQDYLRDSGNPATPAWPAFKLAWLREHDPRAYARTRNVLMPKDFVNYRLTGIAAMDPGDGSLSFLMDPATGTWSDRMAVLLGLDIGMLPDLRQPLEILGSLTADAAALTGLRAGTPVLVGGADYPVALLGSGVCRPGLASDVTGTSCIITVISERPLLDPEICNVATIEGGWGAFMLLETGGDAVRWGRRALHDGRADYAAIMDRAAAAPAGADGLLFLPYLTGERLGASRNVRAQFFGLSAGHGLAHLDRALVEGVAFAATHSLRLMAAAAGHAIERVVASSGASKSDLWLKIKASAYNVPVLVPEEPECGIVGCAAMAATALGHYATLGAAVAGCVRHRGEILPDPAWAERYARLQPIFDAVTAHSRGPQAQALYDALDRISH
ncbi:xylulokinase [Lichenicoccus sp.]|uniref:xylulokinase n=1 Tax=Lichenicoccus sp. TaxID=2781899 RepID=UPI003D09C575